MQHPIEGIMTTTLENIKNMVDVNTIIGEAIKTPDGSTIIPVSRVAFGFVAGGAEYGEAPPTPMGEKNLPFGGGTGAGITVCPTSFLVVSGSCVKLLPASFHSPCDRLIEQIPHLIDTVKKAFSSGNASAGNSDQISSSSGGSTSGGAPSGMDAQAQEQPPQSTPQSEF